MNDIYDTGITLPDGIAKSLLSELEYMKTTIGEGEGRGSKYDSKDFYQEIADRYSQQFYNGKVVTTTETFKVSQEVKDEVKKLFPKLDIKDGAIKIQIVRNGEVVPPHIDAIRKLTLYCVLTNDNALTSFYDSENEPDDLIMYNPTKLQNKRTYSLKKNNVYLFNNSNVHDVTKVTMERKALVINLSNYTFDEVKELL